MVRLDVRTQRIRCRRAVPPREHLHQQLRRVTGSSARVAEPVPSASRNRKFPPHCKTGSSARVAEPQDPRASRNQTYRRHGEAKRASRNRNLSARRGTGSSARVAEPEAPRASRNRKLRAHRGTGSSTRVADTQHRHSKREVGPKLYGSCSPELQCLVILMWCVVCGICGVWHELKLVQQTLSPGPTTS